MKLTIPLYFTLTILLAMLTPLLHAAGQVVPGVGIFLQQITPVGPPTPSTNKPGLKIEHEESGTLPISTPFMVKTILIFGNTLFDLRKLHALVADAEGHNLTLSQLNEQAGRITDYYHHHGYLLARAIIPTQTIQDGVITINIIEARFGNIVLNNHSRVDDRLLKSTLSHLQAEQTIDQMSLDHSLLLLSDIPGVSVNATLKPGKSVGTADLLVDTNAEQSVTGIISMDNFGSRETGRARIGGTVNVINPLHYGDFLSMTGLSSGSDLNYARLAYDTLLTGDGTRLGGSYSILHYVLGKQLASLDAHGIAQVESLWVKHPMIRRQNVNLYAQIQYDQMQLRDDIDASAIENSRDLKNLTLGFNGDWQDEFLYGDISTWSISLTTGNVYFKNTVAQLADAATAKTQGSFTKWNLSFARLQNLGPKNSLYITMAGQLTNADLDQAEKMTIGGVYTLRAYDIGAISGDSGVMGTIEYRHNFDSMLNSQWQAVAFVDSAHVIINKNSWVTGANSATMNGVGVGLNWAGPNQWSARTYVAMHIGPVPVQLGSTASARLWIEVSKGL